VPREAMPRAAAIVRERATGRLAVEVVFERGPGKGGEEEQEQCHRREEAAPRPATARVRHGCDETAAGSGDWGQKGGTLVCPLTKMARRSRWFSGVGNFGEM